MDNGGGTDAPCAWVVAMDVGPHPMLRPGVVVCARGDGRLQVGLGATSQLRVPDVAPVRDLLADLRDGAPAPAIDALDPRAARCWFDLLDHHLVIDGDAFVRAVGTAPDENTRQAVAAAVAEHGTDAPHRDRAAVTIGVEDSGLDDSADDLLALARRSGFSTVRRPLAPEASAQTPLADVVILLDAGVTDREVADRLVVDDITHLPLSCAEGRVRLGPLVVPGRSACLRCVDATRAESDPRHSLVVEQYARHRSAWPAPVPHDLVQIALGCAVRDLSRWSAGARPTTWSAVLEVEPDLRLTRRVHPPHPRCGCAWDRWYRLDEAE